MSRLLLTTMVVTGIALTSLLASCGGGLSLIGAQEIGREAFEAEVRARLAGSEVSTLWLDKQTIGWVDANLPARLGEPLNLVASGRPPDQVVWVAYVEGTLAPTLWPPETPRPQVPWFSKALMVRETKIGGGFHMFAKPSQK